MNSVCPGLSLSHTHNTPCFFIPYTDATYGAWQYSHLIEGKIIITPDDDGAESYTVNTGDSFIIEKGFAGTWKMEENVKLHFYVKLNN